MKLFKLEKSAMTSDLIEYLFLLGKVLLVMTEPIIGWDIEFSSTIVFLSSNILYTSENIFGNMYVCHKAITATQKTKLTPAIPKIKNLKKSIFKKIIINYILNYNSLTNNISSILIQRW